MSTQQFPWTTKKSGVFQHWITHLPLQILMEMGSWTSKTRAQVCSVLATTSLIAEIVPKHQRPNYCYCTESLTINENGLIDLTDHHKNNICPWLIT